MKFVFPTRNYENDLFCRNFQNPRGPWTPAPLPTTMQRGLRGLNMVNIHDPLTALLGRNKLSSDR